MWAWLVVTLGNNGHRSLLTLLDEVLACVSGTASGCMWMAHTGLFSADSRGIGRAGPEAYAAMVRPTRSVISHKHGCSPMGCGCVLFREPDRRRALFNRHEMPPYTYSTSKQLHVHAERAQIARRDEPCILGDGSAWSASSEPEPRRCIVGHAAAFAALARGRVCAGAGARTGCVPWNWTGGCVKIDASSRWPPGSLSLILWCGS